MPFVLRDINGNIAAVFEHAVQGAEDVAPEDPDLRDFIARTAPGSVPDEDWIKSDIGLARVFEDLIDVLIEKKVLMFTDFPDGAQRKLLQRRGLRKEFNYVETLFAGGEDGYPSDEDGGGFL